MKMIPSCQDCGACCHHLRVDLIPGIDDWIPAHLRTGNILKQNLDGSCAALHQAGKTASCTIYLTRPDACRTFQRGNHMCLESIALAQLLSSAKKPGPV